VTSERGKAPARSNRARWAIGSAMVMIATMAAIISYNDGLDVTRMAGNHGWVGYLYPLLPDGLIVICLSALYELTAELTRTKAALEVVGKAHALLELLSESADSDAKRQK
jgi:hypothetical protein